MKVNLKPKEGFIILTTYEKKQLKKLKEKVEELETRLVPHEIEGYGQENMFIKTRVGGKLCWFMQPIFFKKCDAINYYGNEENNVKEIEAHIWTYDIDR